MAKFNYHGVIMKKTFHLSLDQEAVEALQAWLVPKGLTFSGYINSLINENLEAIKVVDNIDDLKDLKIGDMMKLFAGMAEGFKKSKSEGKKKE
jgi:hypothetical protein